MKLLVLGANGQVGFELVRSLSAAGDVVAATRSGRLPGGAKCAVADLSDLAALESLIAAQRPDWVVNAAAYTAVDRAESEYDVAHRINAEAPAVIGRAAHACGASVLHYSTDYVFRSDGARPLREDDATDPVNAYGRSKRSGELGLAASGAHHLIFRTAWVYAARGSNFLATMLRLAATRDRLTVVADQRGSPTTARWLAEASLLAIRAQSGPTSGVFHATCSGETSWYEFARAIFDGAVEAGLIARAPEVVPIPSSDFPTPAVRPTHSVLDGTKLERVFAIHRPDWRMALRHTLAELAAGKLPA